MAELEVSLWQAYDVFVLQVGVIMEEIVGEERRSARQHCEAEAHSGEAIPCDRYVIQIELLFRHP